MSRFEHIFNTSPVILTGGPLMDRIKSEFNLDVAYKSLSSYELVYTFPQVLEKVYRHYIDIAKKYEFPIMINTPQTRIDDAILEKSKFKTRNHTTDICKFLNDIKASYKDFSKHIILGGSMGCVGDAYSGIQAITIKEAYRFHKVQAEKFKNQNIDFIYANIMPEINEIIGMAKAMAETDLPYVISFMVRKNGCLMDGTPIADAIKIVDSKDFKSPFCYMTNCIHPKNLKLALANPVNKGREELKRFYGIKSNASSLSPEELDGCSILQQEDFNDMIKDMLWMQNEFNFKILGGCCGTDDAFLNELAQQLKTKQFSKELLHI